MPATIIVGAQWGDEGKGKATDLLADATRMVVRYQGGNNAGHTVVVGDDVFKLHLVPSGILYPHVTSVIGPGVVVDPGVLVAELDGLAERGLDPYGRVRVSGHAHLIMPWHRELDRLAERRLGVDRIGTTRRGIGPTYGDKAARVGLRFEDLFDPPRFRKRLDAVLARTNEVLVRLHDAPPMDGDAIVAECLEHAERLRPLLADTVALVHGALEAGERVILEGAQGTLLDLDHGTYPFVTSSNPVAGGALAGTGVGPKHVDRVIGITKAYVTRVGAGPFPTELHDAVGERMVDLGGEYGTTTGRRRRVGWYDAVLARYAERVNGLTDLFLTKLDVLGAFETLRVAVAYDLDGEEVEHASPSPAVLDRARPRYVDLPGWGADVSGVTRFADLPAEARAYVEFLEEVSGTPITWVSVGPGRAQTLTRRDAAV